MADNESQVVLNLKCDFYRDGFNQVLISFVLILVAILSMLILSIGLIVSKPKPTNFIVENDWRVIGSIPLDQPYPSQPDLIQWVTDVLPQSFRVDFFNYQSELNKSINHFTDSGWKKFLSQSTPYIGQSSVMGQKLFVSANPTSAPFISEQGLSNGTYAWKIQMHLNLSYSGSENAIPLTANILVVRVSTVNDLQGVRIADITIEKRAGDQVIVPK